MEETNVKHKGNVGFFDGGEEVDEGTMDAVRDSLKVEG